MSKGIAKILSGLLIFGMVAGLIPTVPGGIVHAKASEISGQNATAEPHIHCVCGTNNLATGDHTTHGNITWNGVSSLSDITQDGSYYLTKPVTLKATWTCDYNVNLCLNGNSITCDASNSDTIVINKDKTFILTDCQENAGKITHGESKTGRGIYNYGGTFQMYEGTISGNTGTYGGGVNSTWGKFNMYGGTITGNIGSTVADGSGYGGGGVYNNGSEFNMYGGVISGNNSEDCGGGVFCHNGGSFNMFGGEITDNKSTSDGGGVYFASTGSFNMKGTVNITKNKVGEIDNNLYLEKGKTVSASGLASGAVIGVTSFDDPKEGSPVTITSNAASAENFKSDNSAYEIGTDAIGRVILKKTTTCNVIVSIPDNGSIKHIMNYGGLSQKVTKGNSIEPIILEAGEGYYFSDADISNLTRDGISTTKQADGSIKIEGTPNSDISFTATASKKPDTTTHTITATVEGGKGTISPNGSVSVKEGESQVFTITPNKG